MKPFTKILSAIALTGALAGVNAAEVKIALDGPPNLEKSGSYVWAHTFGEALKSGGFAVRELPRGAVGGEAEKLDQAASGLLEVSLSDVKSVVRIEPFMVGVRLPYIFDDVAHMDRALAAGKVFDRVNAKLKDAGVRVIALVPLGPPSGIINARKTVRTPADMASLRMRALDDAQLALYKAWGTNGTIVSWKEVPAALQTGVVDGYLNTAMVPLIFGQTDIVKFFTDARVINALRAVIVSAAWYDGLSDAQRKTVASAVAAADKANRDWTAKISPKALADLEKAGVEVTRLTDAQRAAFREKSRAVYGQGLLKPDQVKAWVDLAEKTRSK
ncbi:MAG: TRAP transporter substrate-binding protein [Burkholderiaceae bacterium]